MESEKPKKIKKAKASPAAPRPIWAVRLQMALEHAGYVTDKGAVDYRRLGQKFSVVPKAVEHWVKGSREPKFAIIVEIAKLTGCSTDWIFGIDGATPFARDYRPASNGK